MKKEDIKVGMKVFIYENHSTVYKVSALPDDVGEVDLDNLSGKSYDLVHFNDIEAFDVNKITDTIELVQAKLDEAASLFEKAFIAFQEANELANYNKFYDLESSSLIDVTNINKVFSNAGWSTSSLWC